MASTLTYYTLSTQLNISPTEAASLPATLVRDLLLAHGEIELYKSEKMEEAQNKHKIRWLYVWCC